MKCSQVQQTYWEYLDVVQLLYHFILLLYMVWIIKYIYSFLKQLLKKIRFIYLGKQFQKEKRPPRGFEITFKKLDPNLFTIIIISNLQGQSLLWVDKSSWLLYRTYTGDLIYVLGINTQSMVSRPDKRFLVRLKTFCDT